MTKKTIFVDRYGNIRYYLHYKIGKEWSFNKSSATHTDDAVENYFLTITLPLAWWVASISTSAICTCAGALAA